MVMRVAQNTNFRENDFSGRMNGNVPEIEVRISPQSNNTLVRTPQGLYVPPLENTSVTTYVGSFTDVVLPQSTNEKYKYLAVRNGIGIIHIDFRGKTATGGHIFTLPDDAPTPTNLIEVQSGTANFWIDAGQRKVHCAGLTNGTRYILNMMGFFNY